MNASHQEPISFHQTAVFPFQRAVFDPKTSQWIVGVDNESDGSYIQEWNDPIDMVLASHYFLALCSCGSPHVTSAFFSSFCSLCDSRFSDSDRSKFIETFNHQAVGLIVHILTNKFGCLEYGGSIYGAWLSDEGERALSHGCDDLRFWPEWLAESPRELRAFVIDILSIYERPQQPGEPNGTLLVHEVIKANPETAANLIRTWMLDCDLLTKDGGLTERASHACGIIDDFIYNDESDLMNPSEIAPLKAWREASLFNASASDASSRPKHRI